MSTIALTRPGAWTAAWSAVAAPIEAPPATNWSIPSESASAMRSRPRLSQRYSSGTGAPLDSPWPRASHRMTRYRRARRAQSMTRNRSSCSMLLTRPWPQKNGSPSPSSETAMSAPRTLSTDVSLTCADASRGMDVLEPLAGEPEEHDLLEARTVDDVLVRTLERVLDGKTGGLGFLDAFVELDELAARELTPGAWGLRAGSHEAADLVEREGVPKQEDGADHADRLGWVPAVAGDPGGMAEEPDLLVVAQCRRGDAGASRELPDRQQFFGIP